MSMRREKHGTVKIHDDCVVEELLFKAEAKPKGEDNNRPSAGMLLMSPASVTGDPMRKKSDPVRSAATPIFGTNSRPKKVTKSAWLDRSSIETVQTKADLESNCTKQMYTDVLTKEKTFSKQVNDLINCMEVCKLRRKELLHKKWTDRVYEPILRDIVNLIENPEYTNLSVQRSRQYKEYLEHVNKKGHVFLDTFSPDEYYPFALQSSSLVAVTKGLQDPLLQQENSRYEEERIVIQCLAGAKLSKDELKTVREILLPPLPLSRKDINSNDWLSVPLVSIESPVRIASRSRMRSSKYVSQIDFEKWAAPRHPTDKETSLGRKPTSPSLVSRQTTPQPPRIYSSDSIRSTIGQERRSQRYLIKAENCMSSPIQNKGTQTVCVS